MRGLADFLAAWPGESEFSGPWGPRGGEAPWLTCGASLHMLSRLRGERGARASSAAGGTSKGPSVLEAASAYSPHLEGGRERGGDAVPAEGPGGVPERSDGGGAV